MLLRLFYDEKLAQASYLVGCSATGEALVVDANRDVEQYVRAAEREGLEITHVTETHIHADYVSGSRELAERTGARLYLSAEGGAEWQYGFAAESGAVLLRDGDRFRVGNIEVEAVHTPGHTPEHLSFLVTDRAAATEPVGVFTGDFLFVGDVGRPDLLERAAGYAGTMEAGARTLFRSLGRLASWPEHLQIWPAHGAGSACGKSLGAVLQSTLGYERRVNWGLQFADEAAFVEAVLAGQPEPPRYFAEMKRVNREGPALLGGVVRPARQADGRLAEVLAAGGVVLDTRPGAEYAAGHVPGTLGVPLGRSFPTWAGSLVADDGAPLYLIVDEGRGGVAVIEEAVGDLTRIGLDRVAGTFGAWAVAGWANATGRPLARIEEIEPGALAALAAAGEVGVVDVRGSSEWAAGHMPGVMNLPLGDLERRIAELPSARPLVVHCQTGPRARIAAGVLERAGLGPVRTLAGGYVAWRQAGLPVEQAAAAEPVGAA